MRFEYSNKCKIATSEMDCWIKGLLVNYKSTLSIVHDDVVQIICLSIHHFQKPNDASKKPSPNCVLKSKFTFFSDKKKKKKRAAYTGALYSLIKVNISTHKGSRQPAMLKRHADCYSEKEKKIPHLIYSLFKSLARWIYNYQGQWLNKKYCIL